MAADIISPLLTLRKINESQEEMAYITKMRNAIEFQIANKIDYEYLQNIFTHVILLNENEMTELRICLDHALRKVVKSHVLMRNTKPFVKWKTIRIDNSGFPKRRNQGHDRITERRNQGHDRITE
ncbi:uncharacterized protein NPIL_371401, partial [Nephila pilipes]